MRQRLDALTGLRFFAALAVVGYHLVGRFHPTPRFVRLSGPGFVGVEFFFVLSGLVLAWSCDRMPVRTFYRRRFARIWPLHAATLLAVIVLFGGVNLSFVAANVSLTQVWHADPTIYYGYNSVSWTLGCEAFFYLLFPLLLRPIRRARAPEKLVIVLIATAAALGAVVYGFGSEATAFWFLYIFPGYRLIEFLIGMVIGTALARGRQVKVSPAFAVALIVVGIGLTALFVPVGPATYNTTRYWLYDISALPGIALLLATTASANLDRDIWLGRPTMRVLGEWSFALYMTHQIVMRIVEASPTAWSADLRAAIAASLVIPIAGVVHVGFERPVEKFIRGSGRSSPTAVPPGSPPAPRGDMVGRSLTP